MQPRSLVQRFCEVFGCEPRMLATAPGRVNLIGEHVDYNDGLVLPMAIDREILATGRLTDSGVVRLHSADFGETVEIVLADAARRGDWTDYPVGTLLELVRLGVDVSGVEIAFHGTIPQGAGLSSSAALEVATGALAVALAGARLSMREVALASQRAENEFVGTRCGIMDQFASALCREGHLLLLDCRSLEVRHVPFDAEDVRAVIFDTRVERRLAGSAYNDRRAECEQALVAVRQAHPAVRSLRDVTPEMLDGCRARVPEIPFRRARHVVEEIRRVAEACDRFEGGDLAAVGDLLCRSHVSLRDLYEVSCRELDVAFEEGTAVEGILGGRLTGAGFGGCLVFLVREDAVDRFSRRVYERYRQQTGLAPEIYVTHPAAGARVQSVDGCPTD